MDRLQLLQEAVENSLPVGTIPLRLLGVAHQDIALASLPGAHHDPLDLQLGLHLLVAAGPGRASFTPFLPGRSRSRAM